MFKCMCDKTRPYIFISYAHKTKNQVFPIMERLYKDGYNIWFDEGIDPGSEWSETIAERIFDAGYFIAFFSAEYFESENCKNELEYARKLGKYRLIICLSEVTLSKGLDMNTSRIQNVCKYTYQSDEEFYEKIYAAEGIGKFRVLMPAASDECDSSFNGYVLESVGIGESELALICYIDNGKIRKGESIILDCNKYVVKDIMRDGKHILEASGGMGDVYLIIEGLRRDSVKKLSPIYLVKS